MYFDFVAYAQFATICAEMPRGQQTFDEFEVLIVKAAYGNLTLI